MNIEAKNLSKIYQEKQVLHLDSLRFPSGQIHGIIGPNGSGKSTFMKIIAGLLQETTGEVTYNGNSLTPEISMLMTYSSHHPVLFSKSVFKNIAYPLKIRKKSPEFISDRVYQLMDEFDITPLQNQNAKKLSGGESQKTALARALSFSPDLLFLDEPTANIDPKSVKLMEAALLKRNKEEGLTIIIITHHLSQAFRLCDTITFLDQGEVRYSGKPQGLVKSENPYIQDFISINAMIKDLN